MPAFVGCSAATPKIGIGIVFGYAPALQIAAKGVIIDKVAIGIDIGTPIHLCVPHGFSGFVCRIIPFEPPQQLCASARMFGISHDAPHRLGNPPLWAFTGCALLIALAGTGIMWACTL